MKIIGNDGKEYTGESIEEALEKARKADEELEKKNAQEKQNKAQMSKEKKELCDKIDTAEKYVESAYDVYEDAKRKVDELYRDYKKQASEILEGARKAVIDAEEKRTEAILEYNRKYGVYRKIYTDKDAVEYRNTVLKNFIDAWNIFGEFFRL